MIDIEGVREYPGCPACAEQILELCDALEEAWAEGQRQQDAWRSEGMRHLDTMTRAEKAEASLKQAHEWTTEARAQREVSRAAADARGTVIDALKQWYHYTNGGKLYGSHELWRAALNGIMPSCPPTSAPTHEFVNSGTQWCDECGEAEGDPIHILFTAEPTVTLPKSFIWPGTSG